MDCTVAPKVAYWASQFRPDDEAISKEIQSLQREYPASRVFCLSNQHAARWRRQEGSFHIGRSFYPVMRALAPAIERRFEISHVFAGLDEWCLLRPLGRRPLVVTLVSDSDVPSPLFKKADIVVVEVPSLVERVTSLGVAPERIRTILPGVPAPSVPLAMPNSEMLRILFASSPPAAESLESRGLDLLLAAVAADPTLHLTILWRQWSGPIERLTAQIPANIANRMEIVTGRVDIHERISRCHVVAAPFRQGKSCPNSVIEGMAQGRPAILSPAVGIASFLDGKGAYVPDFNADSWKAVIAALRTNLDAAHRNARKTFDDHFSMSRWLADYRDIYQELLSRSKSSAARNASVMSPR